VGEVGLPAELDVLEEALVLGQRVGELRACGGGGFDGEEVHGIPVLFRIAELAGSEMRKQGLGVRD